jgi:hypothetical protein
MSRTLVSEIAMFAALLLGSLGNAQDAASAKAFLSSAFQLYEKGGKGVEYSNKYYHSSLLALIQRDLRTARKYRSIPLAGTDLFCDCQGWDGIWIQKLIIKLISSKLAEADAIFAVTAPEDRNENDLRNVRYTLVPENGQWRIYDILYLPLPNEGRNVEPLRKQLVEDARSLK